MTNSRKTKAVEAVEKFLEQGPFSEPLPADFAEKAQEALDVAASKGLDTNTAAGIVEALESVVAEVKKD